MPNSRSLWDAMLQEIFVAWITIWSPFDWVYISPLLSFCYLSHACISWPPLRFLTSSGLREICRLEEELKMEGILWVFSGHLASFCLKTHLTFSCQETAMKLWLLSICSFSRPFCFCLAKDLAEAFVSCFQTFSSGESFADLKYQEMTWGTWTVLFRKWDQWINRCCICKLLSNQMKSLTSFSLKMRGDTFPFVMKQLLYCSSEYG